MAEEKKQDALYSIGAYAKHLGVTPDFLKHYERYNLVTTKTSESGYRYYPFGQSFRLMECLKLRNLSVSVREMDRLLNQAELPEIEQYMQERSENIRRQIRFEEAALREQERLQKWLKRMRGKQEDWTFAEDVTLLFLPHTQGNRFLEDERISSLLNGWTNCMPVVKSCRRFRTDTQHLLDETCWGFVVRAQDAQALSIPTNDIVEQVSIERGFVYSFSGLKMGKEPEKEILERTMNHLHQMGLKKATYAYKIMFMSTHIDTDARHYGYYLVPLK